MGMARNATDIITDALQAGYGDATQTVLDREVARGIKQSLTDHGWSAPEVLMAVVLAAGGRVVIPESVLLDTALGDFEVRSWRNDANFETVVEVKRLSDNDAPPHGG